MQVAGRVLDRIAHSVQRDRHAIELSPKEFSLLEFLMRHAGQPVSRAVLVEQVWRLDCESVTNAVDVYINICGERLIRDMTSR